jgi:hypothetical protein
LAVFHDCHAHVSPLLTTTDTVPDDRQADLEGEEGLESFDHDVVVVDQSQRPRSWENWCDVSLQF